MTCAPALTPAEMAEGAYIGTVVMYSEGPHGRTVYVSEARTGRVVKVHLHSGSVPPVLRVHLQSGDGAPPRAT